MKESQIKKAVREYLQWGGWFVFHIQQSMGSYPGISDLVACKGGQVLFIEIKTPDGKQSPKQKIFQADLEEKDCSYILVSSIEDVEEYVKRDNYIKQKRKRKEE